MLRYRKSKAPEHHASPVTGLDGLLHTLANVTMENGHSGEVIVPDWLSNAIGAGKGEALTHLAGIYLGAHRNGEGLTKAEPLLREAAEKGYAPAQERLGIISLFGVGRDAAPDEAVGWLRLAADQGSGGAQSMLGMMLAAGAGTDRDLPEAKQLLTLAEAQGDGYARTCLRSGADFGLLPQLATFSLGVLRVMASVLSSLPADADDLELERAIRVLADAGDADACFFLSTLNYSVGNRAEVLHLYLAAAAGGNELAVLIVGLLVFIDHDNIRDMYPVAEWLDAVACQGSAPAQGLLGLMYATGRGAAHDFAEADRLLDQAGKGMDASTNLGNLFSSPDLRSSLVAFVHVLGKALAAELCGDGAAPSDVPFSIVREAMRLAEQGDRFAQFFLGLALWSGQDVTQDRTEAVRWMQAAAAQGERESQFFLGICFDMGDVVDRDREEAIRWFRRAADQGHAAAQFALASACQRGDGVEKDMVEAVHWFRLAAEQGDASAQYWLGIALLSGDGVEEDPNAAIRWLLKAAAQGSQEASEFLKDLR